MDYRSFGFFIPAFVSFFLKLFSFFPFNFFVPFTVIPDFAFLNTAFPKVTEVFLNVTVFRALQFWKAFLPIFVTCVPMVTVFSFLAPWNALSLICTTVQDTLLIVTVSLTVIFAAFVFVSFAAAAVFLTGSSTWYSTSPIFVLSPAFSVFPGSVFPAGFKLLFRVFSSFNFALSSDSDSWSICLSICAIRDFSAL